MQPLHTPPASRTPRAALASLVIAAASLSGCARANPPVIERDLRATTTLPAPGSVTVAAPQRDGARAANAVVVHVTDGDTLLVRLLGAGVASSTESVRLIGIDTPESKRPDTPLECFADEASAALATLVPEGTEITLERDVEERDHYGRLLAYVHRSSDGLFVNFEMVRTGMAATLTIAPNVAHADRFAIAGRSARDLQIGLWSACESPHEPDTTTTETIAIDTSR